MSVIHELSQAVRTRRQDIALSQEKLATMAGLDAAMIVRIEDGTIEDLSLASVVAVLDPLGLRLIVDPAHPRLKSRAAYTPPLDIAARTASTSYTEIIPAATLGSALITGTAPAGFAPHVHTLLDEAPVSLLARVVEQIHGDAAIAREQVWANMRRMARDFGSKRAVWSPDT